MGISAGESSFLFVAERRLVLQEAFNEKKMKMNMKQSTKWMLTTILAFTSMTTQSSCTDDDGIIMPTHEGTVVVD